jgi:DNA mismatch repair protein MutS
MQPNSATKLTPLMQQYWEIKSAHNDKVVLFRMGDFFEMFHRDAEIAAPVLGIALTSRDKKA